MNEFECWGAYGWMNVTVGAHGWVNMTVVHIDEWIWLWLDKVWRYIIYVEKEHFAEMMGGSVMLYFRDNIVCRPVISQLTYTYPILFGWTAHPPPPHPPTPPPLHPMEDIYNAFFSRGQRPLWALTCCSLSGKIGREVLSVHPDPPDCRFMPMGVPKGPLIA